MTLQEYLVRIDYSGPLEPSKEVLFALHRAHLNAISYENLDIHLGRPVTLDLKQIFDKIVKRHRGGWCFEMNGLFAWALSEIGFEVTMLAATVARAWRTDTREGDHLILLVALDQTYLADVGFGTGFLEPIPLAAGNYKQGMLEIGLRKEASRWLFENDPMVGPGYDFTISPVAYSDFAEQCQWLQSAPESGFVSKIVCHRVFPKRILSLRGAVLKDVQQSGAEHTIIKGADHFVSLVQDEFDLAVPEIAEIWPTVWQGHVEWLKENPDALS
ncbi:MAG: arylamine N-acetyltransferase [Chloroflexota bacterium]